MQTSERLLNNPAELKARFVFRLCAQQRLAVLATAFLFASAGAVLTLPWLLTLRIIRSAREGRVYWVRSPFDLPLALFLLLALVAGVLSPLRAIALGSWLLVGLGFVVVLQTVLETLRENPAFIRSLHKAFALGTLVASVYGLVFFVTQHLDRAQLLTLGPQALGFGLMVGILLSLPLLEEPFPWSVISVVTLVLASIAVIATFNRAAFYGLAAGGLTYVWLGRRKFPLRLMVTAALSLVLGLLIAAITPPILRALAYQLNHVGFVQGVLQGTMVLRKTLQFLLSAVGNSDRLPIWQVDLRVIRHYPWFGVGLGGFSTIGREWTVGIPGGDILPPGTPPHSLYLNLAAEVGVPGALAFLAMPLIAIVWALRQRDTYHIGQTACMVGMLAAEIRDGILMGFHMSLGFILILGLMISSAARGNGTTSE